MEDVVSLKMYRDLLDKYDKLRHVLTVNISTWVVVLLFLIALIAVINTSITTCIFLSSLALFCTLSVVIFNVCTCIYTK